MFYYLRPFGSDIALSDGDGLITCGLGRLVVVNWLNDWRLVVGCGLEGRLVVVVLDGRLVVGRLRLALLSSSLSYPLQ